MNKLVVCRIVIVTAALLSVNAFAQSTPSNATTRPPATKPNPARTATAKQSTPTRSESKLPSEQTVNEFMRRMFGYDSTIRWKVLQINPTEIPNVAQVTISINDQQRPWTIYTSPDGQHAFVGELIPFGADPFAVARREMEAN